MSKVITYPSLTRYADQLKLRSLAFQTQVEYHRYVRKLAERAKCDPAKLTEAKVRQHLLYLKEERKYAPTSMRSATAAIRGFYNGMLGRKWRLFDLVRTPDVQKLPQVLTKEEVQRLFATIREERFRVILRLIYACGLRISEALRLEVGDIQQGTRLWIRRTKGNKERYVPLPAAMLLELRAWWKTHRHPKLLFPGLTKGWRHLPLEGTAQQTKHLSDSAVQNCMRLAVAQTRLPEGTRVHTLRHSYATHLLDEGVSIRLISAYLGHANLQTTLIYAHLTAVNEASARAAVERIFPAA